MHYGWWFEVYFLRLLIYIFFKVSFSSLLQDNMSNKDDKIALHNSVCWIKLIVGSIVFWSETELETGTDYQKAVSSYVHSSRPQCVQGFIHLLALFFLGMESSLHNLSITHTNTCRSISEWPALLKCVATGDSSILPQVMSNWWPFIFQWSGCPVLSTYWRPHLPHSMKYM